MGNRTPDLLNAIEALYQLSYDPLSEVTGYKASPIKIENQINFSPSLKKEPWRMILS